MLYSVINDVHPAITGLNFSVTVSYSDFWSRFFGPHPIPKFNKCIAEVCCGKPLKEVPASVDQSLQLLGKSDLISHKSEQHFYIRFEPHKKQSCLCMNVQCECHQKEKPLMPLVSQQPTSVSPFGLQKPSQQLTLESTKPPTSAPFIFGL